MKKELYETPEMEVVLFDTDIYTNDPSDLSGGGPNRGEDILDIDESEYDAGDPGVE